MARAGFFDTVIDPNGRPIRGVTVTVYDTGTVTPYAGTIWAGPTGATVLPNPFTANDQGEVQFWLATPTRVDLVYSKNGYTAETETVDTSDDSAMLPAIAAEATLRSDADVAHAASLTAHSGTYVTSSVNAWDRFSDRADGALGVSQSGHTWIPYGASGIAANVPTIVSGAMRFASGVTGVSYPQIQLPQRGRRIGGRFRFAAGTAGDSAAAFALWATDISATFPAIPNTPIHLTISTAGWIYGYFLAGTLTNVAFGLWSTPLTADGATVYTLDCFLDTSRGEATLFLPDGTAVVVADSHIGSIAGTYACWESYTPNSGETIASFTEVWADSRSQAPLGVVSALARVANTWPPTVKSYAPGTRNTQALSGTAVEVGGTNLRQSFAFPATGKVLVELSVFANMAAGSWLILNVCTDAALTAIAAGQSVFGGEFGTAAAFAGHLDLRTVLTGTPGAIWDLYFSAVAPAGSGSIISDTNFAYMAISKVSLVA
jgi:hypothetical protein